MPKGGRRRPAGGGHDENEWGRPAGGGHNDSYSGRSSSPRGGGRSDSSHWEREEHYGSKGGISRRYIDSSSIKEISGRIDKLYEEIKRTGKSVRSIEREANRLLGLEKHMSEDNPGRPGLEQKILNLWAERDEENNNIAKMKEEIEELKEKREKLKHGIEDD